MTRAPSSTSSTSSPSPLISPEITSSTTSNISNSSTSSFSSLARTPVNSSSSSSGEFREAWSSEPTQVSKFSSNVGQSRIIWPTSTSTPVPSSHWHGSTKYTPQTEAEFAALALVDAKRRSSISAHRFDSSDRAIFYNLSSKSNAPTSPSAMGFSTSSTSVPKEAKRPSKSRIEKLSADLKTRLSYAMLKVQHGWENQPLSQLENLNQFNKFGTHRVPNHSHSISLSNASPIALSREFNSTHVSPNFRRSNFIVRRDTSFISQPYPTVPCQDKSDMIAGSASVGGGGGASPYGVGRRRAFTTMSSMSAYKFNVQSTRDTTDIPVYSSSLGLRNEFSHLGYSPVSSNSTGSETETGRASLPTHMRKGGNPRPWSYILPEVNELSDANLNFSTLYRVSSSNDLESPIQRLASFQVSSKNENSTKLESPLLQRSTSNMSTSNSTINEFAGDLSEKNIESISTTKPLRISSGNLTGSITRANGGNTFAPVTPEANETSKSNFHLMSSRSVSTSSRRYPYDSACKSLAEAEKEALETLIILSSPANNQTSMFESTNR